MVARRRLGVRARRFWRRHRTLFWTLHSLWALATGVLVVWLARERYSFVPWVVLFLLLTWASTLYFGRRMGGGTEPGGGSAPTSPGLAEEATSYLTRTMYQETLFFLLPFYAYSTVPGSPNMAFLLGLGVLAVLSCLDLVFDRILRTSPVASMAFFSIVAFAALNLLLPILLPLEPTTATRIAAVGAVLSAVPLVRGGITWSPSTTVRVAAAGCLFVGVAVAMPTVIPPVPLRLESGVFAAGIHRETLTPVDTLESEALSTELDGTIVALMEVFAPTAVPTSVTLRWKRDGEVIRESREIEILAHELGFRVWDAWRPETGDVRPGRYEVELSTSSGRIFGRVAVVVEDG
ncbi:MAG: DUF5924 family protein [Longimicrobiales bacterium]|nr:DUF5924 family protein [Longimicrobiales bacterium]